LKILLSLRLNSDLCDSKTAVKTAAEAENLNFDGFWYCEDLFKRDAWIVLSAAAVSTTSIKLGTAIVNPFSSHPVELAMRAATLAEISNGRFSLGIGVGSQETLKWAGIEVSKPVQGLKVAVEKVRQLLEHRVRPPLSFHAMYKVPIYVGGQGRKTVELIGRIGDGGLPLLVPPESAKIFLPIIYSGAKSAGRDFEKIDVSGCVWFYVAESREELISCITLRELIAYYGPLLSNDVLSIAGLTKEDFMPMMKFIEAGEVEKAFELVHPKMFDLAITATYDEPEKIRYRVKQMLNMGVRHINIGPPIGEDLRKSVEFIAKVINDIRKIP